MKEESVNQIGCIHTCQGLELDYVGVIIGEDMTYADGTIRTNVTKRSKNDSTVRGYKSLLKKDPIEGAKELDILIKNTYRTLMTRGMKGCFVYCVDKGLENYLRQV